MVLNFEVWISLNILMSFCRVWMLGDEVLCKNMSLKQFETLKIKIMKVLWDSLNVVMIKII